MARKKKTISQEVEAAAILLQLLVRMKAADSNGYVTCVVCGTTRHYKDGMQGGHFISRARVATKLIEENVHPECCRCNMPGSGHEAGYALYMLETYGQEFIDELHQLSRTTKKYTRQEVAEIAEEFKRQIKEQEARIG